MVNTSTPRIYHVIAGLENGGAEAVLYRLCVKDRSCEHVVISLGSEGKYGSLLTRAGVKVHCLNMPRGRVTISGIRRLWRLLREGRPDAVQTWMYHADLLGGTTARLAGIRQVFWGIRHTTLSKADSSRSAIIAAKICAVLSRYVPRQIICCAHRAADIHAKLGYDAGRMRVIPNGYDLDSFKPDSTAPSALRAIFGISSDVPLLGYVARYNPQKDHEALLRALGILQERGISFACLLVGSDVNEGNPDLTRLRETIALSASVHLVGPRDDIPFVMAGLDLHVMSSSFGEAFPNVLSEAMACGTPCVSTDVGDAAEIVGETGWIVPPSQPTLLADALQVAIGELGTADFQARREAARRRVAENFSIQTMISAFHSVWFGTDRLGDHREKLSLQP